MIFFSEISVNLTVPKDPLNILLKLKMKEETNKKSCYNRKSHPSLEDPLKLKRNWMDTDTV